MVSSEAALLSLQGEGEVTFPMAIYILSMFGQSLSCLYHESFSLANNEI